MQNLTLDELTRLAKIESSPAISILMPAHRASQEIQQDPIRFKNLLRQAEQQLLETGLTPQDAGAFLQPAQELLDDDEFWQHQEEGLAVFVSSGDFHLVRLPYTVEEMLVVAQSYYIKPLLPLFTNNGNYYILGISQHSIRLLLATRYSVTQIDLPETVPTSMNEALGADEGEKQVQFHAGTTRGGAGDATRGAVFHGQGAKDTQQKDKIERYLNVVDRAIREFLGNQQTPIVLAGVEYLLPIYHKVSEYPNILEEGITGNPEHLRPAELQEQAWPIVEPYFRQGLEKAIEQYQELAGAGKATDDIDEIVGAAFYGRVDKLIVPTDVQIWGKFDPDTGRVTHHEEQQSEDDLALLDFAAMQTLQNRGTVYALSQAEMPSDAPALAVLRY